MKWFYCCRIEGVLILLVCFAFVFCHLLIFARYIKVCYKFGFLGCVRHNEDFVTSTDPLYPLSLLLFLVTTLFLKASCGKGIGDRNLQPNALFSSVCQLLPLKFVLRSLKVMYILYVVL